MRVRCVTYIRHDFMNEYDLDATVPVPRCCSYKLASVVLCLIVVLDSSIYSVTATDACNGRCREFVNVYCNSGTGVCDDCSIYCSTDSIFYNEEKCDELCSKEPVPTDACANRCIDFPDTYCNSITGSCDSCSIFCSKRSDFYNSTKCAIKCPGRMPTPSPTEGPILSTTEDPVSTQTSGIFSKPAIILRNEQPELKIETTDSSNSDNTGDRPMFVGIVCGLAVFCLLLIIGTIYIVCRKRRKRIQSGFHEQVVDDEKKALGAHRQEKGNPHKQSEMVLGHETSPLNNGDGSNGSDISLV
ncbi:uncharacterized protein LOC117118093 [Anneissia japonica]|uniref:uncharacterized protein LOC117118093 n=1 Tax=Anneissia japonica TaxID=1529436 RepID=UPI0014257A93|nr:uncharacterized protein LOC117118093 [Anneissia japonica]